MLNGVEATGASASVKTSKVKDHTIAAWFTNSGGGVTALTVDLEGSLDNTNWFQLDTHVFSAGELTAQKAMFHIVNKPVNYVRLNITTLTETGTTAVFAQYEGYMIGVI